MNDYYIICQPLSDNVGTIPSEHYSFKVENSKL